MSTEHRQTIVVHGVQETTGSYIEFPINDLSYYPRETLYQRVRETLYGPNPSESNRFREANENGEAVNISRPLAHTKVVGTFLLFLPKNERPWGMMEISELKPRTKREYDLTSAVIPTLALMPFRLFIDSGEVWERGGKTLGKFYVVDREGSNWSIHCH